MDAIEIECPECGRRLEIDEHTSEIDCPECATRIEIQVEAPKTVGPRKPLYPPKVHMELGNRKRQARKIYRQLEKHSAKATEEELLERMDRILKNDSLDWANFEEWKTFLLDPRSNARHAWSELYLRFTSSADAAAEEREKRRLYIHTFRQVAHAVDQVKILERKSARAIWVSSGDEACCMTCRRQHGRKLAPGRIRQVYPAHPGCRCRLD